MRQEQDAFTAWMLGGWSPQFWFGGQGRTEDASSPSRAPVAESTAMAAHLPLQAAISCSSGLQKVGSQVAAELMSLASRRSQAIMGSMAAVGQARTPQELFEHQAKYWQAAVQDHTESARRVAAAWSTMLPAFAAMSQGAAPSSTQPATARDRITLDEASRDAKQAAATVRSPGDRRSAA